MKSPRVIIDANYLCHRAFHSTGELTYRGRPTGTLFGVFSEIAKLQSMYPDSTFVFCFDAKVVSFRREMYPGYKSGRDKKRAEYTVEEQKARRGMLDQIDVLYDSILDSLGFSNVLRFEGFEADDLIGVSCGKDTQNTVVTADHDVYQLLAENTSVYHPQTRQTVTAKTFTEKWGIPPRLWAEVKTIAGCNTDNVMGVKGVGELTAARYLACENPPTTKQTYWNISEFLNQQASRANRLMVTIPFPGTPVPIIRDDDFDLDAWNYMLRGYGMSSLIGKTDPDHRRPVRG